MNDKFVINYDEPDHICIDILSPWLDLIKHLSVKFNCTMANMIETCIEQSMLQIVLNPDEVHFIDYTEYFNKKFTVEIADNTLGDL